MVGAISAALTLLARHADGFFVMVDQAGDEVTWENTLLIVTSDHGDDHLRFGSGAALGRGLLPTVGAVGVPTDPAQRTL